MKCTVVTRKQYRKNLVFNKFYQINSLNNFLFLSNKMDIKKNTHTHIHL